MTEGIGLHEFDGLSRGCFAKRANFKLLKELV